MNFRYTFQTDSRKNTGTKKIYLVIDEEKDVQSQIANLLTNYKNDRYEISEEHTNPISIPDYYGHIQLYENDNGKDLLQVVEKYINPLDFPRHLNSYKLLLTAFELDPQNFDFFKSEEFSHYKSTFDSSEYKQDYIRHKYFFEKKYYKDLISEFTLIIFRETDKEGEFYIEFC